MKTHPDYPFNTVTKEMQYTGIFAALKSKRKVRRAVTFPHLSGFKMERELIDKYPDIEIHCFEKDKKLYEKIKAFFPVPKNVTFIRADAEEYIQTHNDTYDLIFFDYCGVAKKEINDIIRQRLNINGVFALTEYFARGILPEENGKPTSKFKARQDFETIVPIHKYSTMQFGIYKKIFTSVVPKSKILGTLKKFVEPVKTEQRQEIQKRQLVEQVKVTKEFNKKRFDDLRCRGKAFIDYLNQLPPTEQEIYKLYYVECKTQKEIADILDKTQGGISSRIKKMSLRVKFIQDLSKITEKITEDDIEYLKIFFDEFEVDLIMIMARTTCQTTTATILNSKYRDNKKMNQGKVRHKWKLIKEKIGSIMSQPEYARLRKFHEVMGFIEENLYMLHEVKFEKRKNHELNVAA